MGRWATCGLAASEHDFEGATLLRERVAAAGIPASYRTETCGPHTGSLAALPVAGVVRGKSALSGWCGASGSLQIS